MKTALFALVVVISAAARASADSVATSVRKVDFAKDVAPIFKANCVKCHGLDPKKPQKKAAAKLNLETEADALKPGKSGADVIPGDAANSRLFKLLSGPVTVPQDDGTVDKDIPPMPKVKKGQKWVALKAEDVETIRRWINESTPQQASK